MSFRLSISIILVVILVATAFSGPVGAATDQQDVDALKALHTAWLGNPSSWDINTDPCDSGWLGIRCNTNSRVTHLLLINQGLEGTLSPAVGNLTSLTDLDISSNENLGGNLPAEIGNLTAVEKFFVQFCNFSGSIPSTIGNMKSLQFLGLSRNMFTGALPDTIGLLTSMIWLDVSGNRLTGPLPVSAASSSGSGLDNLTKALHFHLQNNSFSGSIPPSIFNTNMQIIHLLLNNNEFDGIIPSNIGDLIHVEIICMDSNRLNNTVPSNISTLVNLTTLQLDNNNLSGKIPDLSSNTRLQMLNVSSNSFDASEIPSWITKMKNLHLLSMGSTNLMGELPADTFGFSQYLSNVSFAANKLNGTLNLTLAPLQSLMLVDLTNNSISNLDKGSYAAELLLDGNPYCSTNQNLCSAPLVINASSLVVLVNCTNECPAGYAINPIGTDGCQCKRPVIAECGFYAMKIPFLTPTNITQIQQQLADGLNNTLLQLQVLASVQKSQTFVKALSSNNIEISVFPPTGETLWSADTANSISYVIQNQDIEFLQIGPISCGFHGSPYTTVVVNSLSTGMKIGIGVGVAVLVIIIVVLGVYAWKLKKRAIKAEKLNKPFAAWIATGQDTADIPQLKGARYFSLEEIRKCTNNFSPSNEIGEGGYGKVYKGFLVTGDGVAIKRASASSLQGLTEFKNEIELLSRVHHRNLVGLIGFCFEEGEQILVYEFMPNGTLRENLSGRTGLSMDWSRRIWFALDSARGIAYLHCEANPPIIHRDIKSSNILLSEKLVARVADFGLSKISMDNDSDAQMSTQVKGTLGYLDPDYYMTNILTEKSDVYSFGVVLLEIVTGRLPIQDGKYIVREVKQALEKGGMELLAETLVDPQLTDCPLKTVERLVTIALSCVQDNPNKRPSMAMVVKEIEALVHVKPITVPMDIEMASYDNNLYGEELQGIQQRYGGTSFQYSGSYVGMSRPIEPK